MKGVYVIEFEAYPGIYKIGCSQNIDKRINQIQNDTILLGKASLVYNKEFKDYLKAEKHIHLKLKEYKYQENREFFKIDLQTIIKTIESINTENFSYDYKRSNRNTTEEIFKWIINNCYRQDTNEILLTSYIRQQMCKELQIKNNQITNSLKRLKDCGKISGNKGTFNVLTPL